MTPSKFSFNPKTLLGLLILGAIIVAVSCSTGGGGKMTTGQATQVVDSAHAAYKASDWETYARWMHPEGLARYESILRPMVETVIKVDSSGEVADSFTWLGQELNTEEFMNMTPAEFFSFSMNEIIAAVPTLKQAMGSSDLEVLGEIPEGDSLMHVVVRTTAEAMGIGMSEVSVLTAKEYEGSYRLLLSGQLEGLITAIAQNIQRRFG